MVNGMTESKLSQARKHLEAAFKEFYELREIKEITADEHTLNTPHRTVQGLMEMFCGVWQDPVNMLNALFDNKNHVFDEMVNMNDVAFVSMCSHHTMPFFGKAHFSYLPNEKIVGASKIPRLIECYAQRPQIQEQLAVSIVDTFSEVVKPFGCGIVIEAYHFCVCVRGVKQKSGYLRTAALRGSYKTNEETRKEFLNSIHKTTEVIWP
jgi:GTP cyclohydrolase IA